MKREYKYRIYKATLANGTICYQAQVADGWFRWIQRLPNQLRVWSYLSSLGISYLCVEKWFDSREEALAAISKHKVHHLITLGNEIIRKEIEYV